MRKTSDSGEVNAKPAHKPYKLTLIPCGPANKEKEVQEFQSDTRKGCIDLAAEALRRENEEGVVGQNIYIITIN